MTTEEKPKRTRRTKAEIEASSAPASVSCDCGEKIAAMEAKIEVPAQYMKTFNIFLNQSMISNTADSTAEEALTEIRETYPD